MGIKRTYLVNATVITPHRIMPDSAICIEDGRIVDLVRTESLDTVELLRAGCSVVDAGGAYAAPGFIDIHVHGGGGADAMDGTPEAFLTMAAVHARGGTTAMVPSTLTSRDGDLARALAAFDEALGMQSTGAVLLGVHLEGPYLAQSQRGAQDPAYIRNPGRDHYHGLLGLSKNIIRVSAAPELPGALELGRELRSRGILASIAHTDATYEQVLVAMEAGFSHMTHLYSGMSGVHRVRAYRVAGAVEAGLLLDDLTVEVIADGRHLPAALLRLIYKCKGPERIALCTDAIRAAGMPDGEYIMGSASHGRPIIVDEGVAWLPDRPAFAGSVAQTNWLVRNMVSLAGASLSDAVKMASLTPARILGIDSIKGSIDRGKDADIVVFDDEINIRLTMVNGSIVYEALQRDDSDERSV